MANKEILHPDFSRKKEPVLPPVDVSAPEQERRLAKLFTAITELFPDRADIQIRILDMLEVRFRQPLRELLSEEVRSQNPSFDATHILDRLSRRPKFEHHQYSVEQVLELLPRDYKFFIDEYVLELAVKEYFDSEKNIDPNRPESQNEYLESVDEMARNFAKLMKEANKLQQRLLIDNRNWKIIEQWKKKIKDDPKYPVGSCIVVISPADALLAGYAGIDDENHDFGWVFRKVIKNGQVDISMTQIKCWLTPTKMEQIQKRLKKKEVKSGAFPELDQEALPKKLTRRQKIVVNIIESDSRLTTQEVIDDIFKNETKDRSKLPNLNKRELERFGRYRDAFLHMYLRQVYLDYITKYYDQLSQPHDHPFWTSQEYRTMVRNLDDALKKSALHLRKCVDDHKISDPEIDLERDVLNEELFAKLEVRLIAQQKLKKGEKLTVAERRDILIRKVNPQVTNNVYKIQLMKELEERYQKGIITNEEKQQYNTISLALLAEDISGKLQCGTVGAARSPLMLLEHAGSLENMFNIAAIGSYSPGEVEIFIANLSPAEKMLKLEEFYKNFTPLTIQTNSGEKRFWITAKHFHEYEGKVYEREDGVIVGPCNFSMDEDELVCSEENYKALLRGTQSNNKSDENENQKNKELFKYSNDELDENLKHRVSITELINNDTRKVHKVPSTGYNSSHGSASERLHSAYRSTVVYSNTAA